MINDGDDDVLRPDELVPAAEGGWFGLLFHATATAGPTLTWGFEFPFAELDRDYGTTPVALSVEWVPLDTSSWRDVAGRRVRTTGFAESGEASVYYFMHHRFDTIDLRVLEQDGTRIRVAVTVGGDLDGLGVDPIGVEMWLRFTGVIVSLDGVTEPDQALARLAEVTDVTGLAHTPASRAPSFRFAPTDD